MTTQWIETEDGKRRLVEDASDSYCIHGVELDEDCEDCEDEDS